MRRNGLGCGSESHPKNHPLPLCYSLLVVDSVVTCENGCDIEGEWHPETWAKIGPVLEWAASVTRGPDRE